MCFSYSTDDGETWETIKFVPKGGKPFRVYGLMTEPGEKTTTFTLFGSNKDHHQWSLVKLDLRHVFSKFLLFKILLFQWPWLTQYRMDKLIDFSIHLLLLIS